MAAETLKTPKAKKPVIVCVDDEKFILDSLARQLQRKFGSAYDYEFAESAEEALEIVNDLLKTGHQVIMVISDQIMPGMSGDQFLTSLHRTSPGTVKILLTGQASLESAVNVINNANLYKYLTKPWSEEDFLISVESGIKHYLVSEEEARKSKMFAQFVPQEFFEFLPHKLTSQVQQVGSTVEREMTVLLMDIWNFSKATEKMASDSIFHFINSYLGYVVPIVYQNQGFVEKYMGDAIMALFIEPKGAVLASIQIQQAMQQLNQENAKKDLPQIGAGMGLHCGKLMLGIVGSVSRAEGNVISDVVTIASYLERLTREHGCRILTTGAVLKQANDETVQTRWIGRARLRHKSDVEEVYEVLDPANNPEDVHKLDTKALFEKGLAHFYKKELKEACAQFQTVLEKNPSDQVAKNHLEHASACMKEDIPADWDGVDVIASHPKR